MKSINIECVNITINLTNGARINGGLSGPSNSLDGGFDAFVNKTLSEIDAQVRAADEAEAAQTQEVPARGHVFDVDEAEEGADGQEGYIGTVEEVADTIRNMPDTDAVDAAYGEAGANAAKLEWAKARVLVGDELVKLADLDEGRWYHAVVDGYSPEARTYVNLYRARDGYAKVGATRFQSLNRARDAASGSNYIATVGLSTARTK
jgi:hypothetical protein